jgi:uncharacterized protein with FMN-binding domain
MRSSKHWSRLLQSSNSGNNKYTKKRPWVVSTIIMVAASVGGAFGINAIWLNPAIDTSGSASGATKTQTVKGDAIQYRYGTVELEVTATAGKIEKITELQASTSSGWESAIPVLNQEAIKAQSANFGNLSGATFITDAYKQALSNALSKLK